MKKIIFNKYKLIIPFLLLGMLILGSCKKYLDKYPEGAVSEADVFSSNANAYDFLISVYGCLTGDAGYGSRISMYYGLDTDEALVGGGLSGSRREIGHYAATSSTADLEGPYNQLFRGIERANICIYNIPKMQSYINGDPETRRMYGEALTLRAQFYTELIRNWGDMPYQFSPSALTTEHENPKIDREIIYDQLLDDLATAADHLPWRKDITTNDERITKGAAKALRARIALYRVGYSLRQASEMMEPGTGDPAKFYDIVIKECGEIMNDPSHKLNPSFKDVFKKTLCGKLGDPTGEVIFQVGLAAGAGTVGGGKVGQYNGPRPPAGGSGGGGIIPLPTAFYAFDSTDKRRDISIAPYNLADVSGNKAGTALVSVTDGKFRREWIPGFVLTDPAGNLPINWPIIRYSDVLLMFAEAENELNGPTELARNAFQQVRARGFNLPIEDPKVAAPTEKAAFFQALVNERMFEFFVESVRKYDLIRWNLLETKINETKANLTKMAMVEAPYDQLPTKMYYWLNKTSDEFDIWINSFYAPGPTSSNEYNPDIDNPVSKQVDWINPGTNTITTTFLQYYAIGFVKDHKELLPLPNNVLVNNPKLIQNPKY